jgi:hypothetical protein
MGEEAGNSISEDTAKFARDIPGHGAQKRRALSHRGDWSRASTLVARVYIVLPIPALAGEPGIHNARSVLMD